MTGRLLALAVAVTLFSLPAAADAALQYPDLRSLPPTDVQLGTEVLGGQTHHVVRFTTDVANFGEGALELRGTQRLPSDATPPLDDTYDVDQWIYDPTRPVYDLRGPADKEPVGTFYYHPEHRHYHFEDFADYELWTKHGFERAAANGFTSGAPLFVSEKVSFCVMDSMKVAPDAGNATYGGCSPSKQGMSKGWADRYRWSLYGQWVDVGQTPLRDGRYVIRSISDPTNKLFESAGKADPSREGKVANSAITYIKVENGQLTTIT
jgi:lysyl oxidase